MDDGNLVMIDEAPIPQQKVVEFVTHPSAGGISIFIGRKRRSIKRLPHICA